VNSSERKATLAELLLASSADVTDAGMEPDTIPVPAVLGIDAPAGDQSGGQSGLWRPIEDTVGNTDGSQAQISALTDAIAAKPEAPMNYVLRGELMLNEREYFLAYSDFVRALALAERALQTKRWGLLAQVARDRAAAGLTEALRRLKPLKDSGETFTWRR